MTRTHFLPLFRLARFLINLAALSALLLVGCAALPLPPAPGPTASPVSPSPAPSASATPQFTPSLAPAPTASLTPSPAPSPNPTLAPVICSPLDGFNLDRIQKSITNPYHPPKPGSDDPHQAVDIADLLPNSRVAVEGRAVRAVFAGRVALTTRERFPYGNLVLVETPLKELPAAWLERLQLPDPDFNFRSNSALTCPALTPAPAWNRAERSLYLLYAHLKAPAPLKAGDPLSCGAPLGAVGMTGNALNPHLHLELRVGPAGARFDSMAHYDASASREEMAAYCAWRISGVFALVDPLRVLALLP